MFDYQAGRSGEHARDFLGDWKGHLVVDGFAGYKALFALGIHEVAGMAHARRKFFDLHAANQSPVAARHLLREREALPKLQAMHDWLQLTRQGAANGSALANTMDYSLKRWTALSRYAHRANLPIDNNPVENIIQPIAAGKKNWLFTGSERAGRRAAAIQSLLATAKLNGIEPAAWLKDTLEKLPTRPNNRIDELLPLGSST